MSGTISPGGTAFTATSTNSMKSVTFNVGTYKVSCTTSVIKGTVPMGGSSQLQLKGGPDITFSQSGGCTVTLGAVFAGTATITTANTWFFAAGTLDKGTGSAPAALTLLANSGTMSVDPVVGTDCMLTLMGSSLFDLGNTYTNNTTSLVFNDDTIAFERDEEPCPANASNGVITGQWSVTDAISLT